MRLQRGWRASPATQAAWLTSFPAAMRSATTDFGARGGHSPRQSYTMTHVGAGHFRSRCGRIETGGHQASVESLLSCGGIESRLQGWRQLSLDQRHRSSRRAAHEDVERAIADGLMLLARQRLRAQRLRGAQRQGCRDSQPGRVPPVWNLGFRLPRATHPPGSGVTRCLTCLPASSSNSARSPDSTQLRAPKSLH